MLKHLQYHIFAGTCYAGKRKKEAESITLDIHLMNYSTGKARNSCELQFNFIRANVSLCAYDELVINHNVLTSFRVNG